MEMETEAKARDSSLEKVLQYLEHAPFRSWDTMERAVLRLMRGFFEPWRTQNVFTLNYVLASFTEKMTLGTSRRTNARLGSLEEKTEWDVTGHYRGAPSTKKGFGQNVQQGYTSAVQTLKGLLQRKLNGEKDRYCLSFVMQRTEMMDVEVGESLEQQANVHTLGLAVVGGPGLEPTLYFHDPGGLKKGTEQNNYEAAVLRSFLSFLFGPNAARDTQTLKNAIKNAGLPGALKELKCKLVRAEPQDISDSRCFWLSCWFILKIGHLANTHFSTASTEDFGAEVDKLMPIFSSGSAPPFKHPPRSLPSSEFDVKAWQDNRCALLQQLGPGGGKKVGASLRERVAALALALRVPHEYMTSERIEEMRLAGASSHQTLDSVHWCLTAGVLLVHVLLHGCNEVAKVPATNVDDVIDNEIDDFKDVEPLPTGFEGSEALVQWNGDVTVAREVSAPFDPTQSCTLDDVVRIGCTGPAMRLVAVEFQPSQEGSLETRLKDSDGSASLIKALCAEQKVMENGGELQRYFQDHYALVRGWSFHWEEKNPKKKKLGEQLDYFCQQVPTEEIPPALKEVPGRTWVTESWGGELIDIDTNNLDSVSVKLKARGHWIGLLFVYERFYTSQETPWASVLVCFSLGGEVVFVDCTTMRDFSSFREAIASGDPASPVTPHNQILLLPLKRELLSAAQNDDAAAKKKKRQKLTK